MTPNVGAKAKRGDLVLIEQQADYEREPSYSFERVIGVTRDGWVRECAKRWFGEELREPLYRLASSHGRPFPRYRVGYLMHWLLRAEVVDVDALWKAWCAREVDGRPAPFAGWEAARAFAKEFKRPEPALLEEP